MSRKTLEMPPEQLAELVGACRVPDPLIDPNTGEQVGIRWRPSDGAARPSIGPSTSDAVGSGRRA